MTTNINDTRPSTRPGDPTVVEPPPTPTVTPTRIGGVEVYDPEVDATTDPFRRPSTAMPGDPAPVEARSTGSVFTWIISTIALIILVYFLLQIIF
jgi:hypothetical protein